MVKTNSRIVSALITWYIVIKISLEISSVLKHYFYFNSQIGQIIFFCLSLALLAIKGFIVEIWLYFCHLVLLLLLYSGQVYHFWKLKVCMSGQEVFHVSVLDLVPHFGHHFMYYHPFSLIIIIIFLFSFLKSVQERGKCNESDSKYSVTQKIG